MDALTEQIRQELETIKKAISVINPFIQCYWSGELAIVDDVDFKGRKPYACGIEIRRDVVQSEARWRTLIHEMLHAFSAGLTSTDYNRFMGWEEGVVEGLQRLLRPQILADLGVSVDESIISADEAKFSYEQHVQDIETLWQAYCALTETNAAETDAVVRFYFGLLGTPLGRRSVHPLEAVRRVPEEKSRSFLVAYSSVSRRLSRS